MRRLVLILVFVRFCFVAQAQDPEKSWRKAVENFNFQEAVELLDLEIAQLQDSSNMLQIR